MKNFKAGEDKHSNKLLWTIRVIMWTTTIIYIMLPFFQAPYWCLNDLRDERRHLTSKGAWLDCMAVSHRLEIPYSGIPTAKPVLTQVLSIACLLIFSAIKGLRCKRRKLDKKTKLRDIIFFILVLIAIIDMTVCLITFRKGYIADLLHPIIVVLCYRSQQEFFVLVV